MRIRGDLLDSQEPGGCWHPREALFMQRRIGACSSAGMCVVPDPGDAVSSMPEWQLSAGEKEMESPNAEFQSHKE